MIPRIGQVSRILGFATAKNPGAIIYTPINVFPRSANSKSPISYYILGRSLHNTCTTFNIWNVQKSHYDKRLLATPKLGIYNERLVVGTSSNNRTITPLTIPQRFVLSFPKSAQPYLRLSRMHQPIGTWLLFWPCMWGLGLGTEGLPSYETMALFAAGAFLMRGAGCTINDMWDRHIDTKVRRTSDRPLASREIRMRHAAVWLILQLSLAFSILVQLNYPCFIIGVSSLALVVLYPLAKRVTNWPQVVLGTTFNVGVLMGFTASEKFKSLGYLSYPWVDPSCLLLYLAGVSWTLIYDTIYAHQDVEDDRTLGLGSTAIRFDDKSKYWLSGFSSVTLSSLITCGILSDQMWPYYAAVGAVGGHFLWQIASLDIQDNKNCGDRFRSNRHVGWILALGILTSSFMKKRDGAKDSNCDLSSPLPVALTK